MSNKINIEDMTMRDARALAKSLAPFMERSAPAANASDAGSEYEIGECYLIRTVTFTTVGRVVRRTSTGLVLDGASWIADTGRFGEALELGGDHLGEVEFRGDGVRVSLGAIVDADVWRHALPDESK